MILLTRRVFKGPIQEALAQGALGYLNEKAIKTHLPKAVRQVDALLANAVIVAPFPGVVTLRDREPGETVAPGAPERV